MKLCIDYVSFEGPEPIIKELAVVSVGGRKRASHFVFAPPNAFSALDANTKREFQRQTTTEHGICWEEGNIGYDRVASVLRRACCRATALYAHGSAKCRVLSNLLGRSVIDLSGEFTCPPVDKMALCGVECLLPCHAVPMMHCAMRSASVYALWLEYYDLALQIEHFCCSEKVKTSDESFGVDVGVDVVDCECKKRV